MIWKPGYLRFIGGWTAIINITGKKDENLLVTEGIETDSIDTLDQVGDGFHIISLEAFKNLHAIYQFTQVLMVKYSFNYILCQTKISMSSWKFDTYIWFLYDFCRTILSKMRKMFDNLQYFCLITFFCKNSIVQVIETT